MLQSFHPVNMKTRKELSLQNPEGKIEVSMKKRNTLEKSCWFFVDAQRLTGTVNLKMLGSG